MKRQLIPAGRQEDLRMISHREERKTSRLIFAGCLALLSFTLACRPQADTAADESALRNLDAQWSKDAAAKDVEKTVSYYAGDAILLPPNAPLAKDKEAIRAFWKGLLASPGFTGGWKATRAEVAKSGDLAYLSGTYETTVNDARGKPVNDRGKYVEVWKKQTDGTWKAVADIFNSDLPLPATPKRKK